MTIHKTCDGVRRRDFLQIGATGIAGVNLAGYLSMAQADELAASQGKPLTPLPYAQILLTTS